MNAPSAGHSSEDRSRWRRLAIPIQSGEYDFADASGTIRGVPRRWRWTVEGLDDLPGAALVALDAIADVLRCAGGPGTDLDSLSGGVQMELSELAALHGERAKLVDHLGENHPLLIATEECDRMLSNAGRVVAAEVGQRDSGTLVGLHRSDGGAPKVAVPSAEVASRGLVGDRQATREHHGRPFQAVCIYSAEVIDALRGEGHPIRAGSVGENLTVSGVRWAALRPGSRLVVGGEHPVVLEISSWAPPCSNIAESFTDRRFDRIDHDKHPGWGRAYAWVIESGQLALGDAVTVLP